MSNHLVCRDVGPRAITELYRKFPNMADCQIARLVGVERKTIGYWKTGVVAPSTFALKALCHYGLDIKYILTGIRGGYLNGN